MVVEGVEGEPETVRDQLAQGRHDGPPETSELREASPPRTSPPHTRHHHHHHHLHTLFITPLPFHLHSITGSGNWKFHHLMFEIDEEYNHRWDLEVNERVTSFHAATSGVPSSPPSLPQDTTTAFHLLPFFAAPVYRTRMSPCNAVTTNLTLGNAEGRDDSKK
ncbi:hypothetical protein Pmani_009429 [Petrolisthes manimaculis]|uniref:Uncharacterized protein n=1 Tax=Petrolisthes manimaculis TaxID=1843537 RepID=A0AAE1Q4X9_9EUCA|nr:hypothetical protein Pmani_009429 [Petrolisthes manimaculis]